MVDISPISDILRRNMKKLIAHIVAGSLGLFITTIFIAQVSIVLYPDSNFFGIKIFGSWQLFLLLGSILGLLNYFVKPILNVLTLPIRIITLNLFSFIINMALVWFVDAIFREFTAPLLYPLFWTTLIIWGITIILSIIFKEHD